MSWQEWDDTPWDIQRAYMEGMSDDESVPLSFTAASADAMPPEFRPEIRKVQVPDVVDIFSLREQLERDRQRDGDG